MRPPAGSSSSLPREGEWLNGKYHLDRVLGQGGMAIVYEATHRNKKRFAIKILKKEMVTEELVRRFLREGYVANTVEHPGAVSVLDDDLTSSGCPFLVMELLHGDTVEAIAERHGGILPMQVVLVIAYQLLDTLVSAHAKKVVHRDLKPANLFLTCDGQVKVLDFGIARLREEHVSTHDTGTGPTMGTPAYMAPEQARGQASQVGPHTDLWAVGATMFNLLSNRTVHVGETAQEIVFNSGAKPAPSFGMVMPNTPKDIIEIIDRALAFDPKDRWASATAMRDAVDTTYRASYGGPVRAEILVEQLGLEAYRVHSQRTPGSNPRLLGVGDTEGTVIGASRRFAHMTEDPVSTDPAVRGGAKKTRRGRAIFVGASALLGLVLVLALVLALVFARTPLSGSTTTTTATGAAENSHASTDVTMPGTPTPPPPPIVEVLASASAPASSVAAPAPPNSTRSLSPVGAGGGRPPRKPAASDPPNKTRDWDRQ